MKKDCQLYSVGFPGGRVGSGLSPPLPRLPSPQPASFHLFVVVVCNPEPNARVKDAMHAGFETMVLSCMYKFRVHREEAGIGKILHCLLEYQGR